MLNLFHKKDKKKELQLIEKNYKSSSINTEVSPLLLILKILLAAAGIYGTVFSFISGFEIEVNTKILVITILVAAVYFTFILRIRIFGLQIRRPQKIRNYILLGSALVYLMAGYEFFREIQNGFYNIENYFIYKFNLYYGLNLYSYKVGNYEPRDVITIFFIFLILLLSILICSSILYSFFQILFMIITLPFIILCLVVGCLPGTIPFAAYLICAIGIFGIRLSSNEHQRRTIKNKQPKINIHQLQKYNRIIEFKIGAILAGILLLLFVLIGLFFTPKNYKELLNIEKTKDTLQNGIREFTYSERVNSFRTGQIFDFELFQGVKGLGGLSGGDLSRFGQVVFTYETALRLKAPMMGTSLYLKGYVGSEYKGTSWAGLSEEDQNTYNEISQMWANSNFTIGNQSSYLLSLIKGLSGAVYPDFQFSEGEIQIESVRSNRSFLYAPYYSLYSMDGTMKVDNEQYVAPEQRKKSFKLKYFSNFTNLRELDEALEYQKCLNYYPLNAQRGGMITPAEQTVLKELSEYHIYEEAYRNFVYDVYTKIPDKGLERIKEEFGGYNYAVARQQYGTHALNNLLKTVQDYLFINTSYTLSPGKVPKGKDYIEYFLFENKKGYCAHYATTATMIFRAMGIPARYVEGYVVREAEMSKGSNNGKIPVEGRIAGEWQKYELVNKTFDVLDSNAHSWVEVYIDGFGWIPIEVTPGNADNGDRTDIAKDLRNQLKNALPSPSKEITSTPKPTTAELNTAEEKKAKEKKQEQSMKNQKGNQKKNSLEKELSIYAQKLLYLLFRMMILLLIILIFIIIRAEILVAWRKKLLHTKDPNKVVVLLYTEVKKILHYKFNMDMEDNPVLEFIKENYGERVAGIILKAGFDQNNITKQEKEEMVYFYESFLSALYKDTSLMKKFYMKYILVFV